VALALGLRLANLEALGYANRYYTAAVASMLQSWPNFFFVAAEPGGAVSVDKPPLGLWLQTISAYFLGVNGPAVLLPEIIAGVLAVVVVHHLVRRSFGSMAGLLAALTLAITPVVVATDRNNTIDSLLILTLLLAAWAFILATEQGRLRYLLLGATLVGLGFNIKMMQVFLPLPAFYALYFFGSAEGTWRKINHLTVTTALVLAVSLAWAITVDLTPASQRPYVGSSGDNSVLSLVLGYNGVERLIGGGPGGGTRPAAENRPAAAPSGEAGQSPLPAPNNNTRPQRPDGPLSGGPGLGSAGPLRLFTAPLSKEISWLLPLGLFSGRCCWRGAVALADFAPASGGGAVGRLAVNRRNCPEPGPTFSRILPVDAGRTAGGAGGDWSDRVVAHAPGIAVAGRVAVTGGCQWHTGLATADRNYLCQRRLVVAANYGPVCHRGGAGGDSD
jgi:4-amino-4-deoxy-L-arabinose transferase-like glycosyltransferase